MWQVWGGDLSCRVCASPYKPSSSLPPPPPPTKVRFHLSSPWLQFGGTFHQISRPKTEPMGQEEQEAQGAGRTRERGKK
jgi:hypothetical protein